MPNPALFLGLSLLTPSSAVAAGTFQKPADPVEGQPGAYSAEANDRRRLLYLEDGRVIRGRARLLEGVWWVQERGAWKPLEETVVFARLEREVLAEAKRLLKEARREDLEARARAAAWVLEQGLCKEGLSPLNRVLAEDPELEAAIDVARVHADLLLDPEIPAALGKERLVALLHFGSRGSAAEGEAAAYRLGDFARLTDLHQLVLAELRHGDHRRRAFAGLLARRLFPAARPEGVSAEASKELTGELALHAVRDRYRTVRDSAALALGHAPDGAGVAALLPGLEHEHSLIRVRTTEALARVGTPAAVAPLVRRLRTLAAGPVASKSTGAPSGTRSNLFVGEQTAIVRDFDVEIAQGQSIADPVVGQVTSGVILDVRSVAQISRVEERRAVHRALRELSGQDLPADPDAWSAWWDGQQNRPSGLHPAGEPRNIAGEHE